MILRLQKKIEKILDPKITKEIISKIERRQLGYGENIISLHRVNGRNVGDLMSAPYHYFEKLSRVNVFDTWEYRDKNKREYWIDNILKNKLIIGGGGLLNRPSFNSFMSIIEVLAKKGSKIVLWGVGHNLNSNKRINLPKSYTHNLNRIGLVGVRDYNMGYEWVPCVSCMAKELDYAFSTKYEISALLHQNDRKNSAIQSFFSGIPIMYNDEMSFQKIIEFIGSTDLLLTSSYHAMYWAILMGKRVIVFPNSSKMFSFKYKVPYCNYSDYKSKISDTKIYDEALEDCRISNIQFAHKVFDYFEI